LQPGKQLVPNIDLNWFTAFNPAWHISLGLPDPSHILPFLAGLMTFVQMRMSQPHTIAEIQDAMFHVTQILQFILPLIMVVISIFIAWQLAAGLALYRVTSLLFNMISQSFITGRGSLFTLPRLAGISDSTHPEAETQRQQTQSSSRLLPSTSSMRRKRASAHHRRKNPKKSR